MPKIGDTKHCTACDNGVMTLTMVHVSDAWFVGDETRAVPDELRPYPVWICSDRDCKFEQKLAEHELQA
jgi:hypothetical protein